MARNLKVAGSNPGPATKAKLLKTWMFSGFLIPENKASLALSRARGRLDAMPGSTETRIYGDEASRSAALGGRCRA